MYTVAQIAKFLHGQFKGDGAEQISQLAPLASAQLGAITFCAQPKFLNQLAESRASVVLVTEANCHLVKNTAIIVEDPYLAFAKISQWFDWRLPVVAGVCQSANIA